MTLSELLIYIAWGCVFFGALIVIAMWRNQYEETSGDES